jgi:phage-related protein
MKTLVIRKGKRLTIRAIAYPQDEASSWDRCDTLAFLQECNQTHPNESRKLGALLTDVAECGPSDTTKFKPLPGTDGIYEFKTRFGFRLLCFWDDGGLIICSHGYLKGSQKAPKPELDKAKRSKRDYFIAKQKGELTHVEPKRKP